LNSLCDCLLTLVEVLDEKTDILVRNGQNGKNLYCLTYLDENYIFSSIWMRKNNFIGELNILIVWGVNHFYKWMRKFKFFPFWPFLTEMSVFSPQLSTSGSVDSLKRHDVRISIVFKRIKACNQLTNLTK
jgi:hypothetical protein